MDSMDAAVASPPESDGLRRVVADVAGWKLIGVAVALQVVLLWDVAAMFLTDALVPGSIDMGAYPEDAAVMALNRVLVVGLWALAAGIVYVWGRKHGLLERLFTRRDEGTLLVASLAAVGLHVLDNLVMAVVADESLGPQAVGEHTFFVGLYGSTEGTLVFGLQCLYYLFEALVVVLMIGLFQRAGDQLFDRPFVPWGGIGLTLTWGALHFLMYPSLEMLALPLAMGIVYLVGRKHIVPVFLAAVLVFLI